MSIGDKLWSDLAPGLPARLGTLAAIKKTRSVLLPPPLPSLHFSAWKGGRKGTEVFISSAVKPQPHWQCSDNEADQGAKDAGSLEGRLSSGREGEEGRPCFSASDFCDGVRGWGRGGGASELSGTQTKRKVHSSPLCSSFRLSPLLLCPVVPCPSPGKMPNSADIHHLSQLGVGFLGISSLSWLLWSEATWTPSLFSFLGGFQCKRDPGPCWGHLLVNASASRVPKIDLPAHWIPVVGEKKQ